MSVRVITNNVPRIILDGSQLTASERADFDYLDWDAIERGEDSRDFVRYRGRIYCVSDFSADYGITRGAGLPAHLARWDGYLSDSFFSAVVVRYGTDDTFGSDYVVMGTVIA